LPHFKDFRLELFDELHGDISHIIQEQLQRIKGVKSHCYVISDNPATDQQDMPVGAALDATVGYGAAILVFGDAEMIYFEGESPNNRLLSKL